MSLLSEFSFETVTSILEVNTKDWDVLTKNTNVYLSIPYLKALESSSAEDIEFVYGLVYDRGLPVIAVAFQIVTFIDKRRDKAQKLLKRFSEKNEEGYFSLNMLVCGNVFSDGENGFVHTNAISKEKAIEVIAALANEIKNNRQTGKKISVVLFKEFWPTSVKAADYLVTERYKDFKIDVNMVLSIHPEWDNLNTYLQSMKAKYRTKAKSAYKKSSRLTVKSLSASEILKYKNEIEILYHNVLEKSDFSFGQLTAEVMSAFKEQLEDRYSFRGVFLKEQLVGFSTAYINHEILEASYVGIDYEYNFEYAVYERLLYDYVEQAIAVKAKELHLGRTSELIKSALGAIPVDMKLYAKHKTPITNLLMASILCTVSPSKFELRKPFKANFSFN